MILKSYAKINLFLNIINKRNDGFHNIETFFQFVSLYDEISLNRCSKPLIKFSSNNSDLLEKGNLCTDAADLLRQYVNGKEKLGVSINLKKNIPIGGGLGGGSSNAAAVLLGLNELWGCNLKKNVLMDLGKNLGSDVPVFIDGYSAYGKDTGTTLIRHNIKKKFFFVIIYPGIHVSSKTMYRKYEINDCIKHINLDNMHLNIGFNSFEDLLCQMYPEIEEILGILRKNGNGSVSGSGSCLYSVFDDEESAFNMRKLIPEKYQTYIVHSLNRI